ncbi:hypothetical protein NC652_008693 [Populus alba x Populus x berolinensis]|uniref:Uncharacterized protein n=1 Tax=Populus alba x Populus x berolinensis TaxID=444605 RepID=A0AAD6R7H1_9ROSI|nr:hypothetical protein NC652_008693 [Populus alba x Populus x berolinensis]KAJ7003572.1 hypothetical protein NC653_008709 [Populus alba x Populus x berolinensis]
MREKIESLFSSFKEKEKATKVCCFLVDGYTWRF